MSFPSRYDAAAPKSKRSSGAHTRTRAIEVAIEQVSQFGFHKMTIAEVAAKTGVSQSGLLHHFPSKVALLAAVLDERDKAEREFLFGDGAGPLGWKAFDALVSLAARNSTRPEWVRIFIYVSSEAIETGHPARDWMERHYQNTRAWLRDAIDSGIQSGEMTADIPTEVVITNTIGLLDGIQQQWVLSPSTVSMVDCVEDFVTALKKSWQISNPHTNEAV